MIELGKGGPNLEYSHLKAGSFEREVIKVGQHDLTFFGVSHSVEVIQKRREELSKAIANASFVIIEGAPFATGLLTEENLLQSAKVQMEELKWQV